MKHITLRGAEFGESLPRKFVCATKASRSGRGRVCRRERRPRSMVLK